MNWNKYKEGKQPCKDLKPSFCYDWFRFPSYKCNCCGKQVVFCVNCTGVHHEDGWESCENRTNNYII